MPTNDQFMRFLAAWALVHETADEGWKAAVERGGSQANGDMATGPDAFVDGLTALVAEEKERLKADLAAGRFGENGDSGQAERSLDELRFEVAELRGSIESLQASVDALTRRAQAG